jgi:hypothetical protein
LLLLLLLPSLLLLYEEGKQLNMVKFIFNDSNFIALFVCLLAGLPKHNSKDGYIFLHVYAKIKMRDHKCYLICMIKSTTGSFRASCKWAHDKFTWRDVKYVINGRSGGAGTSIIVFSRECVFFVHFHKTFFSVRLMMITFNVCVKIFIYTNANTVRVQMKWGAWEMWEMVGEKRRNITLW